VLKVGRPNEGVGKTVEVVIHAPKGGCEGASNESGGPGTIALIEQVKKTFNFFGSARWRFSIHSKITTGRKRSLRGMRER